MAPLIDDTLEKIEDVNQIVLAALLVLGGCVVTFWGGKLFKAIVFFIGFVSGTLFAWFIVNNLDLTVTLRVHLLVSCGVGLFVGLMCVMIYRMSVFTTGAVAGLIVGQLAWQLVASHFPGCFLMQKAEIYNSVVIVVLALIGGLVATKFMQIALRGLTAFVGAFFVASGISFFIHSHTPVSVTSTACCHFARSISGRAANPAPAAALFEAQ